MQKRGYRMKGIISDQKGKDVFVLADKDFSAELVIDPDEYWGVKRAVDDFKNDIKKVSGRPVQVKESRDGFSSHIVICGTIGKNKMLKFLEEKGLLDLKKISGKWETYTIQAVEEPMPGVKKALVIAGSDKRGSIYGIYELSRQMGISPWYWWADVPVKRRDGIYIKQGTYFSGEPSVKYRGIFLNDEAPSLTSWVEKRFGTFNHLFYEKVFELLLRLKANYLWPAMWKPRVFNKEDPLNPVMADKYGIVMGTSHHEPMMRSWTEWGMADKGKWNYRTNRENICRFWEEGLERVKDYEGIITVGMRGDGDEAMEDGGSFEEKKALLERVIHVQREIIKRLYNKDASTVPQMLALYKEVQAFYEKGLKIPEDITLLLADDNYGNIRILPDREERDRPGGYGIYYHFDYVGAPKSYQWINTVPLPKIQEQMRMAYDHGVDRIWIVNVGDLKPMELPIDFILETAWDINRWTADNIREFTENWVEEQFGGRYRGEIADILLKYTKYNGRIKPEMVDERTFSLINYREAERVLREFDEIKDLAERIYKDIEEEVKDAFFQMVLYPARASRNIVYLYISAAKNGFYAKQGRVMTNDYAELCRRIFDEEAADTHYYNKILSGGKWDGMMLQPHIGKSNWRGPEKNTMPEVKKIKIKKGSEMGIYIEGSERALMEGESGILPVFSRYGQGDYYIEIFNRRTDPFTYSISCRDPWIKFSSREGVVEKEERILVSIDWETVGQGEDIRGEFTVSGAGTEQSILVRVFNPVHPLPEELDEMTFVESNGYIAIEAEHYYRKKDYNETDWELFPDYGRTLSAMYIVPSASDRITDPAKAPFLEYRLYIFTPGKTKLTVYTSPGLNTNRKYGLCYSASFDGKEPVVVDTFPKEYDAHHSCRYWAEGVVENVHKTVSFHQIDIPGCHTLRIGMIDPGVVIQKIVIDLGGEKTSFLGPPESFYHKKEE